ncbi:MAG: MATE family efflux transporter [Acholeplasmatales bacterium]|nr:MATE family efflux transporter [Acholeplasmatales bacterium]
MNKSFIRYLIPSVIASLFLSTYCLIDGIFIGQKIGDLGLSAINLAWPITSFLQSIGIGLGLSAGIYISRLYGKKEEEKANKVKLTAIIIITITALLLSLIFFIFSKDLLKLFGAKNDTLEYAYDYLKIILFGSIFQMLGCGIAPLLKNSGKVKIAMVGSISSIVINIFLDYIFIYELNMGLEGAALASVIGLASAVLICIIPYSKEFKGIIINKEVFKEIFLGMLAPFILNYSCSIIIIITNLKCLEYGGDEAVAAYTLLSYLLSIIASATTGVGDAIQPLFSYNHSSKNFNENKIMLKKCILISTILSALIVLIFYLFDNQLSDLYNLSTTASKYYNEGLLYYLIGFILLSNIRVLSSYLYSINEKVYANIITLIEPILLTPLMYIILSFMKLNGIWLSYTIIQLILIILAYSLTILSKRKER